MSGDDSNLFGTIALRSDLVTQDKLKNALESQRSSTKRIGEILIDMRALGHLDVKHILDVQQLVRTSGDKARFCVAAMQNGFVSKDAVASILKKHANSQANSEQFGQIMVQEGLITKEQMDALVKGLKRLGGQDDPIQSRAVQAIRRIDQGGARTLQLNSAEAMILHECGRLIREGVKTAAHIEILKLLASGPDKKFSLKDLMKAGGADKDSTEDIIKDLTILNAVTITKKFLGTSYSFSGDRGLSRRLEVLFRALDKPETRADLIGMLR